MHLLPPCRRARRCLRHSPAAAVSVDGSSSDARHTRGHIRHGALSRHGLQRYPRIKGCIVVPALQHVLFSSCLTRRRRIVASVTVEISGRCSEFRSCIIINLAGSEFSRDHAARPSSHEKPAWPKCPKDAVLRKHGRVKPSRSIIRRGRISSGRLTPHSR